MSKKDNEKEVEVQVEEQETLQQEAVKTENAAEEQKVEQAADADEKTKSKKAKKSKADELETVTKELEEMKDKYLRIFAEFDNFRKRTIKEKQDLIKFGSKDCIESILPAYDDFGRAIKMASENENEKEIPEGILLIYDKLSKALEKQGLQVMETNGADFDPELHEALTKIPAPSEELKGKIIDTVEKGYSLNEKIIRYAKVVVGE